MTSNNLTVIKRKGEWCDKPRVFSVGMIINPKGVKLVLEGQKKILHWLVALQRTMVYKQIQQYICGINISWEGGG